MVRRLIRCLGAWLWAMYLVLVIAWAALLVLSSSYRFEATLHAPRRADWVAAHIDRGVTTLTQRRNAWVCHEDSRPFAPAKPEPEPPFAGVTEGEFRFAGLELTTSVDIGHSGVMPGMGSRGYTKVHTLEHRAAMHGMLTATLLALPLAIALVFSLFGRRRGGESPRGGRAARWVLNLAVGGSLWLIAGVIAFATTSAPRPNEFRLYWGPSRGTADADGFWQDGAIFAGVEQREVYVEGYLPEEPADRHTIVTRDLYQRAAMTNLAPAIPLWLTLTALAVPPVISLIMHLRPPAFGPGCCKRCGYDLRGSPAGVKCPECGAVSATVALAASL